jgi:succinyl-diaminopimelate desuccinylase
MHRDWDDVAALTEELLAIPSPSGEEHALCDRIEQELRRCRPHALIRAGDNLCVLPRPPRAGRRTLLLGGHLDTVPALGPNPPRRDGDRLYGLGASDMKGAVAVQLATLARACAQAPAHDLVGVLYANEEVAYDRSGMPVIRAAARDAFDRVDLAILMEPTDGQLELGCLGTCHARVTFCGQRAHSARPWQGRNAIHAAGPLLERLRTRAPVVHRAGALEFQEVVSATLADMRGARNIVPDRFTLNLNYRFAPGKDEAQVRADLDALIAGEAEWELTDFAPAGRVCDRNPLLAELRAAAPELVTRSKQAWTDVGRLSQWGIDAVNWGPGATAQAHQADEWVSVASLARAQALLRGWLFRD